MLLQFFYHLRDSKLPVSTTELLTLLEALSRDLTDQYSIDQFYSLARVCLVKNESLYDKFDQAFAEYFEGLAALPSFDEALIPEHWLSADFIRQLSEEDKKAIAEAGGIEALLDKLRERLEEQKERHAGGSKWIGTGGTSAFGHSGYHPNGIRIGGQSKNRQAAKVWEKRHFKDLDSSCELGTRNLKIALRKLRQFARTGAAEQLDLDGTIGATAKNAGMLDLKMVPERHNAAKVLILFDIGGSMDAYIKTCEELFSAARSEFKHLEFFYFHNCIYETVWKENHRRHEFRQPTLDLIHRFTKEYRLIIVGDASMSPYELTERYGSVEHMNQEAGAVWLQRLFETWPKAVWLNPTPEHYWRYTHSTEMIRQLIGNRMHPLTLQGLTDAIQYLSK